MVEYIKNGFDFAKAKLIVLKRHKEMQELQEHILTKEQYEQIEEVLEKAVDEQIVIPTEPIDEPNATEIITTRFQVYGTKEQLINLKNFMIQNNLEFKNI